MSDGTEQRVTKDGTAPMPLAGVRVLDLATMMAAPWTAAYLAEMGADVIKVEYPNTGDLQRRWGTKKEGQALFWKSMSRNKRSITLDLKAPAGAGLLKQLVATADVVVENFRPGTLERWGLGYDVLAAVNPRLVMLRVTGFGQSGPYRARPGFGTLAEGLSGFAHLTGIRDGPPTLPNMPLADGIAGITGAFAIMTALYYRDTRGGLGQAIDLSLYEPLLRIVEPALMDYDQLGIARTRIGNGSEYVAPRNTFECNDGRWIAISTSAQSIFERLMRAIDRPELIDDPRFVNNQTRLEHAGEIDAIVAAWVKARSYAEVMAVMEGAEVASAPIYDVPAIFADEHFRARETFVTVEDPDFGPMRLVNVAARFSRTPGRINHTGPALGAHNREVYEELGLTADDLERLAAEGVI